MHIRYGPKQTMHQGSENLYTYHSMFCFNHQSGAADQAATSTALG